MLVFLNAEGKEVARINGGLKSVEDALLLDRFVTEKNEGVCRLELGKGGEATLQDFIRGVVAAHYVHANPHIDQGLSLEWSRTGIPTRES